jgi:exodeoxyribonuclease VII large subunit
MTERWGGVDIALADVQVQGEAAVGQLVRAIEHFNAHADPPEVLVITRGGGSAEDLAAFNTEQVTRAVAASRIPTLVAIGHEVDLSLAELAADKRASTPSNAAQLLVPDKRHELAILAERKLALTRTLDGNLQTIRQVLQDILSQMNTSVEDRLVVLRKTLHDERRILDLLNPQNVLRRGYGLVYRKGKIVRSVHDVRPCDQLIIKLQDGVRSAIASK